MSAPEQRLGPASAPAAPSPEQRLGPASAPAAPSPGEAELEATIARLEAEARSRGPRGTEDLLTRFHEESALGKAYDGRLVRRLWPWLAPYRGLLGLALFTILLAALGSLARPLVMKLTFDSVGTNPDALLQGGLTLAAIVLVEQALSFGQVYATQWVGAHSMADLRRAVFAHLHRLRLGHFDRTPVGRLVTRVTNDIDAIFELFAMGVLSAAGDLVRLVGIVAFMLVLDARLALFAFAAAPPVALLVWWIRRGSREAFREIRSKTARMNATMNEQVNGMVVVQAFQREESAAAEFDAINRAYRDANVAAVKFEAMQDAAIEMIAAVATAMLVVAVGYEPVSFGTLVAFTAYIAQFFEPISTLAQRYTFMQSAMAGAERVFGLLDTEEPDAPVTPGLPAGDAGLALELDRVTFGYRPDLPVLRDVTLAARPGEKIALVGPTGAGKSTITAVLLRLYEVEQGAVRVGGVDARSLEREALRRRFAVVPQDVYLFPGTVASNVAAGEEPDPARVRAVLERIGALELFERREGGIDAPVKELGQNFSAGERQLIAFARALYRDAPILILDEATASVDSDTEARLQRALATLLEGRTAIIIAHRLSTIRAADRIVVLQRGRVVEQGTHEALVARGGLYARLHELQFARGERHAAE